MKLTEFASYGDVSLVSDGHNALEEPVIYNTISI